MGVLLQGFFKLSPKNAVPSPADGDASVPWWWDHLASQANDFRLSGFTAVWIPPVLKTSTGSQPGSDGYGPFDDYDIGSRNQKRSIPTRFGTREQLQQCAAIMRANGLDIYLDMVEHHRSGDTSPPFVFRYPGADGAPEIGRFPKNPLNFLPNVPRDPNMGGPPSQDPAEGREFAPINAKPPHYVSDNLISASDWLTALDAQGYRLDDVKGLSTDFLLPFLNAKSMAGKFAVGEFFDGNLGLVQNWVFNPGGMRGRASAFDFPLKFALNAMCNNPGNFNMASLDHAGLAGVAPLNAVTFVENHDTDLEPANKIVTNKLMGYAYILTSEGYPCVFYRDYSTDKNCFGLKPQIDNLIWIHENLAAGDTLQRWKDFDVFAYERLGGPHLLAGLNNDPTRPHIIQVFTGFGPGVTLHDYTGHGPDVVTDGAGSVTITVPRNVDGLGYVCYSKAGIDAAFIATAKPVTQDFEGAVDLDIPPASNGQTIQVAHVWCAGNTPISAVLTPDKTNWAPATSIKLELQDPDRNVLSNQTIGLQTAPGTALQATAPKTGFHTLEILASNLPAASGSYTLSLTYTASQQFTVSVEPHAIARASAAVAAASTPAVVGSWSDVIKLPNVPIHTHLLPTGKVLFWGRRQIPGDTSNASLNERQTFSFVWDPVGAANTPPQPTKNQPALADGTKVNLFCAGHTILPDGRLLVIGGHLFDSQGVNQACIYDPDPEKDSWSATAIMNLGRWYPTAVTLPDGSVLACSGTFPKGPVQQPPNGSAVNTIPQIWNNGAWTSTRDFEGLPLFPRMHVAPDGRVFMSGGLGTSFFLDVHNGGTWTPGPARAAANRDYAPSVMYDAGKVIFIGGGSDTDPADMSSGPPTNIVEIIDLNTANPAWRQTSPMNFARRQHNATILADGTVLVTGGTQGKGSTEYTVFNDLTPGAPIHAAELWDPATGKWSIMAEESVDRCYHSTAILLPDARVLSGGGGEYDPNNNDQTNNPKDSHPDVQIFSPPYLFKGARPVLSSAPAGVTFGQTFDVQTPTPAEIGSITWIRLSSVTHSFDQNQRLNFLVFSVKAGSNNTLSVTAPANSNICPPGHYMLFLLSKTGVPSIAKIVQIGATVAQAAAFEVQAINKSRSLRLTTIAPKPAVKPNRPPVVVGITATCPYGISACWGGAYHALNGLDGVQFVTPEPNAVDSTADVYLKDDGLPDIDRWPREFANTANGTHHFLGAEVTVQGSVTDDRGTLKLEGNDTRPPLVLAPIQSANKVQWDQTLRARKPLTPAEQNALGELSAQAHSANGNLNAMVTGPLLKTHTGFVLQVRKFQKTNP